MKGTRAITLRLDSEDYDRLVAVADSLGMPPAILARACVRGYLRDPKNQTQRSNQRALEALDRLAALTADLPQVDFSEILEEYRLELEQRPILQ